MAIGSTRRWNQKTAMKAGLVFGGLGLVYNTFVTGNALGRGDTGFIAYSVGALLGPPLLFCGIAGLRNWLVIGRQKI